MKITDQLARLQLFTNVHSPAEFDRVFGCKPD